MPRSTRKHRPLREKCITRIHRTIAGARSFVVLRVFMHFHVWDRLSNRSIGHCGPDPGGLNSIAPIDWQRLTDHEWVCRQGERGLLDLE